MDAAEKFLSSKKRYQPILLPKDFSDEEMARDWTLSEGDKAEIGKYRSVDPAFLEYLFKLTKRYNARDIKRFNKNKRYALMF